MRLIPPISMSAGATVIVGLNAALQKRFILAPHNNLIAGNVHRAHAVATGIGGKGQDVYVTLKSLQYHYRDSSGSSNAAGDFVQLAQFLGQGPEGQQFEQFLSNLSTKGASPLFGLTVRTQAPLRTCTSVVGADSTTELVEPSGVVLENEWNELLDRMQQFSSNSRCSALAFMGSLPPGCPQNAYAQIYEILMPKYNSNDQMVCVIDSIAGLDELLHSISKQKCNSILKVNASELCRLVHVPPNDSGSDNETGGVAVEQIVVAISQFLVSTTSSAGALTALALTDGAHPAYLAVINSIAEKDDGDIGMVSFDLYRLAVPNLHTYRSNHGDDGTQRVLYPIGAGDAVAAGTLAAWQCLVNIKNEKEDKQISFLRDDLTQILRQQVGETENKHEILATAFSFGLAVGSASCMQEENSFVTLTDCLALFQQSPPPAFVSRHSLVTSSVQQPLRQGPSNSL